MTDFASHIARAIDRLANALASYTPQGGVARDVSGLFEDEYELVSNGLVSSTAPAFSAKVADMTEVKGGRVDALTVNGVDYVITEAQKSIAAGTVRCILAAA